MSPFRASSFGALLCPAGVHVVACSRRGGTLRIDRYASTVRPGLTAEDAAPILADLLEAEGARGKRVSVAVTGFGSCHQILTLPPAGRELLQPIVTRELRRFYPDLFAPDSREPIVDFVAIGSPEELEAGSQREILVAAVPQDFLRTVAGALGARGIQLQHWTIVPRSLQRLYDTFAGPDLTAAALVLVPDWPLLGFFHDGEIRLFSEPRSGPGGGAGSEAAALVEQVERGAVFLRQQFRGATAVRLFLAADRERTDPEALRSLREQLPIPTEQFGPLGTAPGALAALGAALDAGTDQGLNLLPADLRPRPAAESWVRTLALASGLVLALASGWWAWSAVRAEARAREERDALLASISARAAAAAPVRTVIAERQAHAQRSALLEILSRDQRRLPELLWPLQAAEGRLALRQLEISRRDDGWHVLLSVSASGGSSAEAADALMALADQMGAELPRGALDMNDIVLDRRQPGAAVPPGAAGPIAASVQMSFILPASKETNE